MELNNIKDEKVFVKVNGKDRELKFNFSAWAEIEKRYGSMSNIDQIEKDIAEKPFEVLPELIYIGLVDKSDITKENCLDDYGIKDMKEISVKLFTALYGALPEGNEEKGTAKKTKAIEKKS